jgi:hypothetical protein
LPLQGVRLPARHVFVGPTIAELAQVISADPDLGHVAVSSRHADSTRSATRGLDEQLRAVPARRNRRQAMAGDS